uniref:Pericentrin n=1 Tax=Kryptolebias marmoratus TaxID=37003 RepID=A0A3Q3AKC5_KRYMA
MDEDERQRKLEAGRAKLASFRQKRAKSDGAGAAKKTQKRKGQAVKKNDSPTQDRNVDPAPPSAGATERVNTTDHEVYHSLNKLSAKLIFICTTVCLTEITGLIADVFLYLTRFYSQILALDLVEFKRIKEATSKGSGNASPECFSTDSDTETDTVLHKLMTELEEERKRSQRASAELAEEMEKNQHVLLLLEEEKQGREEERKAKDIQQYKEEKEKLNREVLELRKKLQEEEDAEVRRSEAVASSARRLQTFEEEKLRQEEEMRRLKGEVERVRQLLDESEKELKRREEEESLNTSLLGDILMERYLSSAPLEHSHSSLINESFEHCSQLEISADCSFELNSDVFGDQPLLSVSNRVCEDNDNPPSAAGSQHCAPEAGDSSPRPFAQWPHNSASGEMGLSQMSEPPFGDTGLEKELLNQQCEELREELALKERDLNVLREEVLKSSEELEEARSRWAQVTEELRDALFELEEEKEKRRNIEEEMNLKAHEQENLITKLGALFEERENAVILMGQEAESTVETSLLVPATEEEDALAGEGEKDVLSSHQDRQDLLQVSSLQEAYCEHLISKLEETKMELKTTSALLNQKTIELDAVSAELETTCAQVLKSQTDLGCVENQTEEDKRREQQMDEQIKKMEQVLEEELEQFENMLKAKDVEVKKLFGGLAVKEATEKLKASHQQEIKNLMEKHQQEVSELNANLETELLKQKVSMEEQQTRQISLIKQVTEREHERMISELAAKHNEELDQLRTEVSLELRESMEAAHQAELQQAQTLELEALRLSLTTVHVSQLEDHQVQQEQESALGKVQDSVKERVAQDLLLLEARHQSDLDQIKQRSREQQDRLLELHKQELGECRQRVLLGLLSVFMTAGFFSVHSTSLPLTQAELQETKTRLEELQTTSKDQAQKLEEELKRAWADRDAAVLRLEEERDVLKQSKEQEVGQLWTQLESMRTSRQELGELKEQLLARSAQVDDIERLKTEFNEQKRELKERNEAELEDLRSYFEKRLQASEESYKEEVALLQLRLVESALEDSVLQTTDDKYGSWSSHDVFIWYSLQMSLSKHAFFSVSVFCLKLKLRRTKMFPLIDLLVDSTYFCIFFVFLIQELLDALRLELEETHAMELSRLQSALTQSFKEELEQVRSIIMFLTFKLIHFYYHLLQVTLLEEALKEEKEGVLEKMKKLKEELQREHENEISALKSELEEERTSLREAFDKEKIKWFLKQLLKVLCCSGPQVLAVKQRLEAQCESELQKAKSCMSAEIKELAVLLQEESEEKLRLAQQRFQEEKATLEQHLFQKYEKSVEELKAKHEAELERERTALLNKHSKEMDEVDAKHRAQLESLSASHRDQLAAMTDELESKHNAELDRESLEAAYQETNRAQLEALEADLARKHQEDRDELERRMLGNMDTLETTYLKEVQRHRQDLLRQKQASVRDELRKELAQVHVEKFRAMAAELSHVHKIPNICSYRLCLNASDLFFNVVAFCQVLELEQQHGAALQELSQTCSAEKQQHHLHLQVRELKGTSARELEACRRELEESSSRQRQHFLEEVELLKVQSEEQLQDRINQLKTEFDEHKEAELEDLRRSFAAEQREKEQSYTNKMSQLTVQLQQLDAVVAQLRAEVGCLQGELQGKSAEMETMDTLLQRRERETQEGGNLLKMLTDDLQAAKEDRLHGANEKLSKVLIEMLRSVTATEELIGQKIDIRTTRNKLVTQRRSSAGNKDAQESGISVLDVTEDTELTQLLCESLLVSDSQLRPGGEESALNACDRLRHTVDTLLELLNQANTQLEQARGVHLSLEEKFSRGREDTTQLVEQHKLLMKQLDQEAKKNTQLQLELHKAEGLLDGYVAEKAALEESLQQKENQEEKLVEELEGLKDLSEEHTLLLRQKEHLSAGLGEREKALLAETERLTQEKLDLQRQAEKDHSSLSQRLRTLERELEDQETKDLEKELHHKTHTEDLGQRVQALEKQLKHDRQFIEEQAVEREHERDEFQQEIRRLEAQLKQTANVDNKGHRVESLQTNLKDKIEAHASLLAANQQAQRDLGERNEEIDKLAGRIRELEQALLNSAESVRTVSHLEEELHKAKLREQELTQDKLALEQQQLSSRLQISALQSKLDETRHCYHDNTRDPTEELREALDAAQQSLHSKEQEVEVLVGQMENSQRDLSIKEAELKHLTLQLELLTNKNAAHVQELQEQISALNVEETEEQTLPAALLQEKNQEIDHLNCEIQRLEQELENARNDKVLEVELEDLRSKVEHLQSEISRVRHEKQEEEERLHEVISTLQAELATLGPNVHEVSDSQDGDSINPSPAPSPEPQQYHQEQERRGKPKSLKHEISLTNSAASSSLRARLKALQSQFETAVAEKEGLERLLLTQEEEYRGQGEEFGKRLKAEREKSDEVQGLLTLKEAELKEAKAIAEEEREKKKLSEEERDLWKVQAGEANTLREEKAHLNALILDLQKNEQDQRREIENLTTKEQEMTRDMEALRKNGLSLERQVQEMRAEKVDMEELVNEGREQMKTLKTVKGELSAEREALRRRESQLQEEIQRLRQEATSMKALIQDLTFKLHEKETNQEEAQKEVLTHADVTLAKADAALRQKEAEFAKLRAEYETLKTELAAVKRGLNTCTEQAEGQTKDRALVDLETENKQLKAEVQQLQEDLALQEDELAYERRELQELRQQRHQQDALPRHRSYTQKGEGFQDVLTVSRDEASLSSPEVLRRLECSEDRIRERFQASALDSRLFELSGMNSTGVEPPQVKPSPGVVMERPRSRTITPDPTTLTSHSPGSLSGSDNFSVLNSADTDKVHELEELDLTAPPSPLGSTSSLSAQEWNTSDGYGSNVSSELGARLRAELEQTERLDTQFIQYLHCRGMNPTVNTDSAAGSMSYSDDLLSPELQGLLKKVYQESCRILTLSQRQTAPSAQPPPPSDPPMTWQQEKRALQETVIALRELLCRMAQRQVSFHRFIWTLGGTMLTTLFLSKTDYIDDNWNQSQLQTGGQAESQLRAELEESQKQLKYAHDKYKCEVMTLKGHLEQEKVACSNLRQELQIEQSRSSLLEKQKTCVERLLREAESRLAEFHSKLADSHRKLDEERDRWSRQADELGRRHEADAARDGKFISDLRSQLEQERRQGEELAAVMDRLRAELLQSRRKWEEEEKTRREQLQREQEAATRQRVALETLKEQKQEITRAFEGERERSKRQGVELAELKERLRILKEKERERDEKIERERKKERQEQMEREARQERTNNKLLELDSLRRQDQQRMQELQRTLTELEREEREMASQRLSGLTSGASTSSSNTLEALLRKNSELTERVTSLGQERSAYKNRLTCLEKQLRRTENELARVTAEMENRPVDDASSNSRLQRYYERYLRAESFRKALVYQKRYLLLLLGGFQDCEQATLCLIARMGARPSTPLASQHKPLGRFRATVRVVIAVMRFLTRKWQRAIRRFPLSGNANGHVPVGFLFFYTLVSSAGCKAEVLRQQQPRSNSDSTQNRDTVLSLVPPSKSSFRLNTRFGSFSPFLGSQSPSLTTQDPERSLTEYIHHLEKVQQRLVGARQGEQSENINKRTSFPLFL